MADATTPDSIVAWTNTDPASLVQESQAQAASIQAALDVRQRYSFYWTGPDERDAQTGMVQGSTGYQANNSTEYIYENFQWRLATPYAQFSSAIVTVDSTSFVPFSGISFDSANTTSNSFVVPSSSDPNAVTFTDPGIYAISVYAVADAAVGGVSYVMASRSGIPTNAPPQLMRGPFAGDNVAGLTVSPVYLPAGSLNVWFYYRQNSGADRQIGSTIRIARLG